MRSPPRPEPGTFVSADIELLRPLSTGGMGSVWVAKHHTLRTEVAVKRIATSLEDDPVVRARFEREATRASRVRSPHVVRILERGVSPDGHPFIVMELLEGRDLRARLKSARRLPPHEALSVAKQLAHALGKAHEQGIVHRDLKPSNVFLCDGGSGDVVKLLDFGVAKETGPDGALTTTSAIGTPSYMSPEQLTGADAIDHRCDVWALGVVVFEMLTGQRPFVGATSAALALAIHTLPHPSMCALDPSLPDAVDAWFEQVCARDPAARFTSVVEAARALEVALATAHSSALTLDPTVVPTVTVTDAQGGARAERRPARRWGTPMAAAGALALVALAARFGTPSPASAAAGGAVSASDRTLQPKSAAPMRDVVLAPSPSASAAPAVVPPVVRKARATAPATPVDAGATPPPTADAPQPAAPAAIDPFAIPVDRK